MIYSEPAFVADFVKEGSIRTFLLKNMHASAFAECFIYIKCLDGNTNLDSINSFFYSPEHPEVFQIVPNGDYYQPYNGIFLTFEYIRNVEKIEKLFYGFDEVWFMEENPFEYEGFPKPEDCSITTPGIIDDEKMDLLQCWMTNNKVILGLGDGVGMNFILNRQHKDFGKLIWDDYYEDAESKV